MWLKVKREGKRDQCARVEVVHGANATQTHSAQCVTTETSIVKQLHQSQKNAAPQQPVSQAGSTCLRRANAQERRSHAQCFSGLVPLAKIDKTEAQHSCR